MSINESTHTVVIGGGQAGLAAGYWLARKGEEFVILDAHARIGEAWRIRWDSLRLFTPSQFNGLPGMPSPKPAYYFPTKDEVADYLEAYARQFRLPLRHSVRVDALDRRDEGYQLSAGGTTFFASNVIIATGPFQTPYTPSFAKDLDPGMLQLHSSAYRNSTQVPVQNGLVVGGWQLRG